MAEQQQHEQQEEEGALFCLSVCCFPTATQDKEQRLPLRGCAVVVLLLCCCVFSLIPPSPCFGLIRVASVRDFKDRVLLRLPPPALTHPLRCREPACLWKVQQSKRARPQLQR